MKILAIESSGQPASVALVEDGMLRGEFTINHQLTHSVTLMPMLEEMLRLMGEKVTDVDAVAVSGGPGSFTGLRIGVSAAKGLALASDIPVIRVSSLTALAYNAGSYEGVVVCPIMDARRGQVYCAAYMNGLSLIEDGAKEIHAFLEELNDLDLEQRQFVFLGDGVPVHEDTILAELDGEISFTTAENNRQRAASVAVLGSIAYKRWLGRNRLEPEEVRAKGADALDCFDEVVMNSDSLVPEYLRQTQAEREMQEGRLEDAGVHSLRKIARGDGRR